MRKRTEELLKLARYDIIGAISQERIKEQWDGMICSLTHQSIEKGLKAIIFEIDGSESTTHSLEFLLDEYRRLTGKEVPSKFSERFEDIEDCGVGTRYHLYTEFNLSRREMVQLAQAFHKWVIEQLR